MPDIRFRLTNGQRQLIDRRRRGETQTEAALRLGVHEKRYRNWELGREKAPFVELHNLHSYERCLLLRLEVGLTQKQLSLLLGCSKVWLNRMERGISTPTMLMEYWDGRV